MESLPEPSPRRLLLLPLLLLILRAPELGPSQAKAEETDWVRLPSKCEGEGAGLAGRILPEGRARGRGLWGGILGSKVLGPGVFLEPTVCLALCWAQGYASGPEIP